MLFSGESILIILLVGLIVGWLASKFVPGMGFGVIGDIAIGIVGAFIGSWLTLASRDPVSIDLSPSTPPENVAADLVPNDKYEAVVLPLTPLRPLLKPIIYRSREEICDTLAEAARSNDLPTPFFIRLLYQESSFRPGAISSAGALGIAQFMPETAADRGLDNPRDPLQAIPASARLLRDLFQKFGNLGLAAAAYNAGPKRVEDWLANRGKLPQETQDYVKTITSWPAETWTVARAGSPAVKVQQHAPCQEAAGLLAWNGPDQIPMPPRNPRAKDLSDPVKVAERPTVLRAQALQADGKAAKRGQDAKTTVGVGN